MAAADASLISLVGERIRARRRSLSWTLDELAERSSVSRRMLVNVEQGSTNASLATLLRLSEALGIGLPSLVAPGDDGAHIEVTRADSRPALWAGERGGAGILAAGITAPHVVELWDWTLDPGDAHASEPHVRGTRELLAVIEGSVVISVAGDDVVLGPGDAASFAGDVAHGYRNGGDVPARFALTVFEPAAGVEARR
jgi:transcriptional regulator with XRE-family HTH domain